MSFTTREIHAILDQKAKDFIQTFNRVVIALNTTSPQAYHSGLDGINKRVKQVCYDGIIIHETSNDKVIYEIGGMKLCVIVTINPIKEALEFKTYKYVLNLNDETLTKKMLVPIESAELLMKFSHESGRLISSLKGKELPEDNNWISPYLLAIVEHFS